MVTPQSKPKGGKRDLFAERYARCRERLSPSFKKVAAFIESNRIDVMTSSAIALARMIGTSDATVVRTVQALGFEGLQDLRSELAASYENKDAPVDNLTRTWVDVGENVEAAMDDVLRSLGSGLESMRSEQIRGNLVKALQTLHVAERIAIFGIGPTAHIGAYFAARLRRKGRKQLVLNRTGSGLADQLLELDQKDAVLMLAYGQPSREVQATLSEARRLQVPVVLVTDSPAKHMTRTAAVILKVPRGRSGRVALHGTTVACLEMLLLGLATTSRETAVSALGELERLRETMLPTRGRQRTDIYTDEE